MKSILFLCGLLLFVLGSGLHASDLVIAPAKVQNGVFYAYTGFEKTVLELKDGHFRYWLDTDSKSPNDPVYPLSGTYSINGDTITLNREGVYRKTWTFRTVNGKLTLWYAEVVKQYESDQTYRDQVKTYGNGAILLLDQKPAEELWSAHGAFRIPPF